MAKEALLQKISERKATVGVIGLGYVGLPLVLLFNKRGFPVIGIDVDPRKVEQLRLGNSYIEHISSSQIEELNDSGSFRATTDPSHVNECDAVLLCVPTPLTRNREPDMTYIERTAEAIAPHLRRGQLISLESTTYPGTTAEVLVPILEKQSGLIANRDFFVAYSPEREDPNNQSYSTETIPKVVGGDTADALELATELYGGIVKRVVPVSSAATAEATKLVENIFRCVNIAMVNELKMVFQRMGIDIWEVIEAAKTKPFGYMPFYPGPGLGGHCIPIDPFYLTWKAREFDMPTKFIELAGEINSAMPYYVVNRTMEALNEHGKALKGSRLLLIGLAYKKDVDDLRESPTLKLIELFESRGAVADYHDSHIAEMKETREHPNLLGRKSVPIERAGEYDAVIISTNHSDIDYAALGNRAKLIVDTRNAMAGAGSTTASLFKA
ncbi:MAG TPA: nucleotide sugar dehydrogenase [Candidatus Sumerlaeota bacterium]|nr:nucleotide sugar dehydrogenase [Candidatus Sumerlaeota bacterium]HMZ51219.1 nucleotide sugar dehydrogenase [Candidatus Sumerlaeota bacterium]HNM45714.1 nucleotide sugar dehydrogenase [Candidatus Sumerlaeota bacterium]